MADAFDQTGPIAVASAIARWTSTFAKSAKVGPSLLFGLRLWTAVCLALFVAFWLELDNPFWAGTSAAVVCQPQLGASLRKGWFRMIGTVIGASTVVVLTACFPQDRIAFLMLLAFWCGLCAFATTVLRNACGPMLAVLGLQIGQLLAGAVAIEVIFGRAGIGSLLYNAISSKDIPTVQGGVLFIAVVYVALNLIVDVLKAVIDPRTRRTASP